MTMSKTTWMHPKKEQFDGVFQCTVKPVVRDHPFCHKKVVSQDRWSWNRGLHCIGDHPAPKTAISCHKCHQFVEIP